ncbi:MAG: protein phosphatase 2C domain-containing protein [Anaerolineales bacterium]
MIRVSETPFTVAALTHPGLSGKQNEDRFAVSAYRLGRRDATPSLFAVVSDGIGGHRAGEVAAEIAVEVLSQTVAASSGRTPLATLQEAVREASQAISNQARDDTQRLGMGTTCACVWIIANRLYTASVGDSRIYLLRGDSLQQLSTDHTWIQEAVERGLLDPEEARRHPNMHVIRRYLGSTLPPRPDLRLRLHPEDTDSQAEANQGAAIQAGDVFLLCTDGLTDLVTDDEIRVILSEQEPSAAAQALIDLACERGGHDNITVVLIAVPPHFRSPRMDPRLRLWLMGAGMGAILLALILIATFWALLQALP